MDKTISKITVALIFLLAFAATSTASAQTAAKSSYLYGIGNDGVMKWYRHTGSAIGVGSETAEALQGPNEVGASWNDYSTVFSGGLDVIYLIRADGTLEWRRHVGARLGLDQWSEPKTVGRGWGGFKHVFSGGGGIIYAITPEGSLRWYRHRGYTTGDGLETPNAWQGPKEVGRGWGIFKLVFPGGRGIIYAITHDGRLRWYRHNGYQTGDGLETPGAWEGPKEVGRGWADFRSVFSSSDGIIYAVTQDGKLVWYKHKGYQEGSGLDSPGAWEGPREVSHDWGDFVQVFALLPSDNPLPPSRTSEGNVGRDSVDRLKGRHAFQPENSIQVSVRYKKEFGYLGSTNAFGDVGPTSCNAFSVSAIAGDGSAQQVNPIRISSDSKMEEIAGYYFCKYLVSDIPLNQPTRISVRLTGFDQSVPWKGGSQGQPPPGQQRTIIIVSGREGDPLVLTDARPRARQLFEMVYATQPR